MTQQETLETITPTTDIIAEAIIDPQAEFAALGLTTDALRAINDLGYGSPTPIQQQTISRLLAGKDVIAQAPTGTGKTAAFGLPIVERLIENDISPQALVIVPTRELAIQAAEALHTLGKYREMVTLPIYGGQPYERQLRALSRGVQVVVGTPGRLLDHIGRKTLNLSNIRTVVLDEADEMLNMGFIDDIEAILAELPKERQSALFSATIPPRIARLAEKYLHSPERISVDRKEQTTPNTTQAYYEVSTTSKIDALARILDLEEPGSAIVFVRTRRDADEVAEQLNGLGYLAQPIHGEINQAQRERALERFRSGRTQLLVATDVAARGLDIPDVSHVINFDLPLDTESYVHRIGRTGRAGRNGKALTLIVPRERRQLRLIEQSIRHRIQQLRLPTSADVAARRRTIFRAELLSILDAGQLDPFLALVEDLAGSREPAELAAAAFKLAAQSRESTRPSRGESWLESLSRPETNADVMEVASPSENSFDGRPPLRRGPRIGRPNVKNARVFLRIGRQHGIRPANLVAAIVNEAGLPPEAIGDIDLYDTFSFVEVPEDQVTIVIDALNATTIRGKQPKATVAKPEDMVPGERPDRPERRFNDDRSFGDDRPRRPFAASNRPGTRRPFTSHAPSNRIDRERGDRPQGGSRGQY